MAEEEQKLRDLEALAQQEYLQGDYDNAEIHCMQANPDNRGPQTLLLFASILFEKNKFDLSEYYLAKVIAGKPQHGIAEAYNMLGKIHQLRDNKQQALKFFHCAAEHDYNFLEAYVNISDLIAEMGNSEQVIQIYTSAVEANPYLYTLSNDLGSIFLDLGFLKQAKFYFSKSIAIKSNFAAAWNNLGCVFRDENEIWLATHHFEKAVALDPNYYDAYFNLGSILKKAKIYHKSKMAFAKAQHISPDDPYVLFNLGSIYFEEGFKEIAKDFYKKAIEIFPNYPDAYYNLGTVFINMGKTTEAEKYFNTALFYCPTHTEAFNSLANIKKDQGKLEEALMLYMKCLENNSEFALGHSNLANLYKLQGNLANALTHYKEAVRIQPDFEEAYIEMGDVLNEMLDFNEANNCYLTAVNLNPTLPNACLNKANTYEDLGLISEAIEWYRKCLKLKPNIPDVFYKMFLCQLSVCDWTDYDSNITRAIQIILDHLDCNNLPLIHPQHTTFYHFGHHEHKRIAEKLAEYYLRKVNALNKPPYVYRRRLNGKLKIGYVCSDFGELLTSHLMQSIPGSHNRDFHEIYCYALNPDNGTSFRSKIIRESSHFVDLSDVPCNVAANMIHMDGIHVLINMNGFINSARFEIFALRPAPIQVLWSGYSGTSGATFIDYLVTDQTTCPKILAQQYSENFASIPYSCFVGDHKQMFPHLQERIVILPDDSQTTEWIADNVTIINTTDMDELSNSALVQEVKEIVYSTPPIEVSIKIAKFPSAELIKKMIDSGQAHTSVNDLVIYNGSTTGVTNSFSSNGEVIPKMIIVTARQQYSLPNDAVVYCNFNQFYKINPSIFKWWTKILKNVPNSVLWLLRFTPDGEQNIRKVARELELPQEQIIFSNVASNEEHVRRCQLTDVGLDTITCNGQTTNMDLLWTGTPIVTIPTYSSSSRVAASQLGALGCEELVAKSKEDYVDIATRLGTDRNYLKAIQAKIRKARMTSSLFDCSKYVGQLEVLYSKMWMKYENNLEPDHM